MKPKNRFLTCEICGERSQSLDRKKRKFMAKFPLDESRCRQWVKSVGKEDLIYVPIEKLHALKYVCGAHFQSKDFNKKKNRLKKSAVPLIDLRADPLPDDMLLEFPCHISTYSDISTTQDNENSTSQINVIGGPSYMEIYLPGHQPANIEIIDKKLVQSQKRKHSEESTSKHLHLVEHDYDDYCMQEKEDLQPCRKLKTSDSEEATSKYLHLEEHDYDGYCMQEKEDLQPCRKVKTSDSEESTSKHLHLVEHDNDDYCMQEKEVLQPCRKVKTSDSGLGVSPREKRLIKKITSYKSKISVLRKQNIMPRIKSLALKTLIKAYMRNHNKKPQGKRWTSLEKALAIGIYKKSPRTYRHLLDLMELPSVRTLQTLLQCIELEPGISQTIMEHLKKSAATLNEQDKLCALLFDEIALKKHLIFNPRTDKVEGFVDLGENQFRSPEIANHALVFMLQGLHKKLKQPIAYYFVKGPISSQSLAVIIKDVINAVFDIGYTIITTVCDPGPTNIGSLNLLKMLSGVTTTTNYFLLDDKRIYTMFDIPHLFKSIRNSFHSGGVVEMDGKRGKWSHLLEVAEKNNSTLHFKTLTALHVNPTIRSKTKVKLAAQVLSNTVAAILKLMAETYGNDEKGKEMLETAQIVEDLDRLFDCTNGPASEEDIIKNRRENVSSKTNHIELWRSYKAKLSTMRFLTTDSFLRFKNVRSVEGYVISLSSLEDIWKYVQAKGFKYLNLRQLNQDCLENLFGMIRKLCPTNRSPTCHHFTTALKSNILTKLSTPVARGANCEENENEAIIDYEDFFANIGNNQDKSLEQQAPNPIQPLPSDPESHELHSHLPEDFEFPDDEAEYSHIQKNIFETFKNQPNVYVAGYLASSILKKIKWQCDQCELSLKTEDPSLCASPMYNCIKLSELLQDKSLTYPTVNLCELVDTVTLCFETEVKPILHELHISQQAVTIMLANCDNLFWLCNSHKDRILHILLVCLCQLLIRNECHRINLSFAKVE